MHFCVCLVNVSFKQIKAETREKIVYLCNKGKSQRFIAEETRTSHKVIQGVIKRWRGLASLNFSLNLEESESPQKNLIELW